MKTIVWLCILIIVIASGISYFLYRTPLQKQSADHIISEEQEKTNSKHLLLAIVTPEYDKSMKTVTETTETVETAVYEDVEQNANNGGNNVIGGDING